MDVTLATVVIMAAVVIILNMVVVESRKGFIFFLNFELTAVTSPSNARHSAISWVIACKRKFLSQFATTLSIHTPLPCHLPTGPTNIVGRSRTRGNRSPNLPLHHLLIRERPTRTNFPHQLPRHR